MIILKEKFGRRVRLTSERQSHITRRPEMRNQLAKIKRTLAEPEVVRRSRKDPDVYLYYRHYKRSPVSDKYMLVVVKMGVSPFVVTAFFTDKLKPGETLWPNNS